MFKQIFDKEYTEEEDEQQFMIRIDNLLGRFDRIKEIYSNEPRIPEIFFEHLQQQIRRLKDAKKKFGRDNVSPKVFENQ